MGNSKMPKYVGIFNLLAKEDCLNSFTCENTCYALFRQGLPVIYNFRKTNSILARKQLNLLKYLLLKQIAKEKIRIIRIHEAGDFISKEYINMWSSIADIISPLKINIFTMTKTYDIFSKEINAANTKSNFNIANSFINGYRNYGSEEYCNKLVKKQGAFKCPDHHDGICMTRCKYCLTESSPCFVIHGNLKNRDKYKGLDYVEKAS